MEEIIVMKILCMILRDIIECLEIVIEGINEFVGIDLKEVEKMLKKCFLGNWKMGLIFFFWDGKIVE